MMTEIIKEPQIDIDFVSIIITTIKANVIKFILEGGSWIALRPSGTEPKLKIYGGVKGNSLEESKALLTEIIAYMEEKMKEI